ncbi:MAG: GatB/YqeY domain-containing protein [Clostridia bacterium]|nr:GatB/YqeY domain-containing protein [Clostridia bacterium]
MKFESLQKEMIAAMKAGDKARKTAISLLVAAVKKEAIDNECRDNIPDDLVDKVLLKEAKLAKEQVDTCPESRPELKSEYEFRYNIFKEFAPAQLSPEDIKAKITAELGELVESKNKGMLMKSAMQLLKGQADGKIINQIVSELCK